LFSRRTRTPLAALLVVPVTLVVLVVGVWVTGGVLTDDAFLAKMLATAWLIGFGLVSVAIAWRWRQVALPLLASWAVGTVAVGGYLLYTSSVDHVVHEQVAVAGPAQTPIPAPTTTPGPTKSVASPRAPVLAARGAFTSGEHETTGTASLIDLPDGRRVLTLTGFATSPGPDLRVYLTPGDGQSARGHVDLGHLKGNKGDQQYVVPPGSPHSAVVIWCRAFSARFGSALLS
jgi:hypothetical protein